MGVGCLEDAGKTFFPIHLILPVAHHQQCDTGGLSGEDQRLAVAVVENSIHGLQDKIKEDHHAKKNIITVKD
jgi:hypothetical protein